MGTFWLVLFVLLLVVEIMTMGLTTIWFAGGALIAFLINFLEVDAWIQVVVFLLASILLLVLTRPIAMKFFNQDRQKTNVDSIVGQKALVIEAFDAVRGIGRVEVNGMEWLAKVENPENLLAVGERVVIEEIQGVKLIVKKEEE